MPTLRELAEAIKGFKSAMICTADGFNLCTLGLDESGVRRLAALTSSMHSIADAVTEAVERLTAAANTEPDAGPDATHSGRSAILAAEIERPRVGPMRDIVATIQPEQDEIVRSDLRLSLCVQGAPGTGKTAVGLHRAAWLLYAHRDRLSRSGVLVVGPNTAFLDHIGAVLPALGEVEVRHTTAAGLVASTPALARVTVRAIDDTARATLKGDIRMAQVLYAAVWAQRSGR